MLHVLTDTRVIRYDSISKHYVGNSYDPESVASTFVKGMHAATATSKAAHTQLTTSTTYPHQLQQHTSTQRVVLLLAAQQVKYDPYLLVFWIIRIHLLFPHYDTHPWT